VTRDGHATRCDGDDGAATSLAVALLTPLFVVLASAAFQAAMWSHTRTEIRVIARDTAALVGRSGMSASDAAAAATRVVDADTDLRSVRVEVERSAGVVSVTIAGEAPGIIRGTAAPVAVTSAVPVEELTP
jgi:hypothetical protein